MKRNKVFFILLGVFVALQSIAQEKSTLFPDTLKLRDESGNEILVSFFEIASKKQYFDNELWKSMLNIMESAGLESEYDNGINITYLNRMHDGEENVVVLVKPNEDRTDKTVIDKNSLSRFTPDRIRFQIIMDDISIQFDIYEYLELDLIKSLNVETIWKEIDEKYSNEGNRNYYLGEGSIKYNNVTVDKIEPNNHLESVELGAGIGLGYYRDRFIPDINIRTAFNLYDRFGKDFMEFGFIYRIQYLYNQNPEGKFSQDVNGWLSGFVKLRRNSDRKWGLEVGSLIQEQGDFYNGDTWKFSIYNRSEVSNVVFGPELVFTDNFKSFFPAVRFGYTF